MCLKCNKNKGRLGAAPNKYCYRKACVDAGRAAGHIKPLEVADADKRWPTPTRGGRRDANKTTGQSINETGWYTGLSQLGV